MTDLASSSASTTASRSASRWAIALILVTIAGFGLLRSSTLDHGLRRTEHAFLMAETYGESAEDESATFGGRLVTLLLPGSLAHLRAGDRVLPGGNLPARGLLGTWLPWHALYLGWLPLLLALLACFDLALRGRFGTGGFWFWRLVLLAGLIWVALDPGLLVSRGELLVAAAIALLCGFGLLSLTRNPQRVVPAMSLSIAALALATAQIVWAVSAGAGSDESAMNPWLSLVDEPARAHILGDPALLALNADHLRSLLDQAAITGFVSLCALLWFLKRRDGLASAGLILVVAADFTWHHFTLA